MLAANPILHARTKHIELELYFIREKSGAETDGSKACAFPGSDGWCVYQGSH